MRLWYNETPSVGMFPRERLMDNKSSAPTYTIAKQNVGFLWDFSLFLVTTDVNQSKSFKVFLLNIGIVSIKMFFTGRVGAYISILHRPCVYCYSRCPPSEKFTPTSILTL